MRVLLLHDAGVTATCVSVCKKFVCPYASCRDCCIMLCWSWSVGVVVVVKCCCCIPHRLVLMLVLTFAPSVLTFALCTCGVNLLSTSASTPLAHILVVTGCNLSWWCFPSAIGTNTPCNGGGDTRCNLHWWSFSFHPRALVHILHLRLNSLHCVVVVCGGGSCMWRWRWYIYIYI